MALRLGPARLLNGYVAKEGPNPESIFSRDVGLINVQLSLLGAISLQDPNMSISSLFVSHSRDFMGGLVG